MAGRENGGRSGSTFAESCSELSSVCESSGMRTIAGGSALSRQNVTVSEIPLPPRAPRVRPLGQRREAPEFACLGIFVDERAVFFNLETQESHDLRGDRSVAPRSRADGRLRRAVAS
jgi:hypothetical protein